MKELIYGNEFYNMNEVRKIKKRQARREAERKQREEKINDIGTFFVIALACLSPYLMFAWWLFFGYL